MKPMHVALRPFKVLGIQQIAIGGTDKTRLQTLWIDMLGLEMTATFKSERENVDEDICTMGRGATRVEVDLMQPLDPDKKPAVHPTPLNHSDDLASISMIDASWELYRFTLAERDAWQVYLSDRQAKDAPAASAEAVAVIGFVGDQHPDGHRQER